MSKSINILFAFVLVTLLAAGSSAFTFMPGSASYSTDGGQIMTATGTSDYSSLELTNSIFDQPDQYYPGSGPIADAAIGGGGSIGGDETIPDITASTPETTTLFLFGIGLAGIIGLRYRPRTA